MPRIKIDIPESFIFQTVFSVRITDLNYGAHVGNDKILSFMHEARVRYLSSLGYSELNFEGVGLIMADAGIIFKSEIYYGDELLIGVQPDEAGRVGFDLIYKIEKKSSEKNILAAIGKTAMICFDYENKKVVSIPEKAKSKMGL
jgi:acyl-CoA thioester hydrolase